MATAPKAWFYVNLSVRVNDERALTSRVVKTSRTIRAWYEASTPTGAERMAKRDLASGAWMPGYGFHHTVSVLTERQVKRAAK